MFCELFLGLSMLAFLSQKNGWHLASHRQKRNHADSEKWKAISLSSYRLGTALLVITSYCSKGRATFLCYHRLCFDRLLHGVGAQFEGKHLLLFYGKIFHIMFPTPIKLAEFELTKNPVGPLLHHGTANMSTMIPLDCVSIFIIPFAFRR